MNCLNTEGFGHYVELHIDILNFEERDVELMQVVEGFKEEALIFQLYDTLDLSLDEDTV